MLTTARRLARATLSRPRQADLRRAVSTAYYALFHALAEDAADLFMGGGADVPRRAWTQVYRSLDHGAAKTACTQVRNLNFPMGIKACADAFLDLQQKRHDADYDPNFRLLRADAQTAVVLAEHAIRGLKAAPKRDRRAFAVLLLFKRRP